MKTVSRIVAFRNHSCRAPAPGCRVTLHDRKIKKTKRILEASTPALLTIARATVFLPAEAAICQSVTCENCGEETEVPRTLAKEGTLACMPRAEHGTR